MCATRRRLLPAELFSTLHYIVAGLVISVHKTVTDEGGGRGIWAACGPRTFRTATAEDTLH